VGSKAHYLQAAFILYIYILVLVVIIIQTYKLLEKLVAKKNHIKYFKWIFYVIPFLIAALVWLIGTPSTDAYMLIVFSAIISILGLLMIEFRKKGK
jgi:predicted tellurium resistance membrane protein TerC